MINYRVANLDWLLEQLRAEGIEIDPRIEEYEYGRFAWIMDPEGNRIELWEPPRSNSDRRQRLWNDAAAVNCGPD
jgi:predicted enzyme related to lactoylglutathione lyase